MAEKLIELLATAPFPVFGVRPAAWDGPSFVGSFSRTGGVVGWISFVYLDRIDGSTMGACVSNLDAKLELSGGVNPIERHLVDFVARFDPAFVVARVKRRRFDPFPEADLITRSVTAAVAGETVGASLLTHRALPLQLLRTVKRIGDRMTDVGVATWRLSAIDIAAKVDPIDPASASQFDLASDATYPPPEWQ